MNKEITNKKVLLITEDGKQLEISREEALKMAEEADMDLMQVSEKNTGEAVCKIVDYSKILYDRKKAKKKANKANRIEIKEIRLSYRISENDLDIKVKNCRKMIEKEGNKVRVTLKIKGRITKFIESEGIKIVQKFADKISEFSKCYEIKMEGNTVVMLAEPIRR